MSLLVFAFPRIASEAVKYKLILTLLLSLDQLTLLTLVIRVDQIIANLFFNRDRITNSYCLIILDLPIYEYTLENPPISPTINTLAVL